MTRVTTRVRRRTWIALLPAAMAAAALAPAAWAQGGESGASTDNSFRWEGRIPSGSWLHVANLNGGIRVTGGSGDQTVVTAEKRWRRGDPSRVRIETVRNGDDIVVCALWHPDDQCTADGIHYGRHEDEADRDHHQDVSVTFTVTLARGVRIRAGTVNGGVSVHDATSEVRAHTVNGTVEAYSSGGPVHASTVNGSVRASMASLPASGELDYGTVNGSVTLTLPSNISATVDLSTVNGSIRTDFPLTIEGRMRRTHLSGKIGSGEGQRIRIHTVNGGIELLKGS
ncbi:MAG TPA: DUF4097 family beta strand repeat-containing protein [Gemmatimonadaceae bacterium]|nr:DUF4097 family beta strand repeat-containing protein [Gemmatimonadaceae bacterium]